jgi:hypothetical protein
MTQVRCCRRVRRGRRRVARVLPSGSLGYIYIACTGMLALWLGACGHGSSSGPTAPPTQTPSASPTPSITVRSPTSTPVAPTPTPMRTGPPGCHDSNDCMGEECFPPGEPACLASVTPTPNPTPSCRDDSECSALNSGLVCDFPDPRVCPCCNEPACVPGCVSKENCRLGQSCSATHHCVPQPCATDSDCPQYFACSRLDPQNGSGCARRGCGDDSDCDGGVCVDGYCYGSLGVCTPIPA